jgi:hypothetical protein
VLVVSSNHHMPREIPPYFDSKILIPMDLILIGTLPTGATFCLMRSGAVALHSTASLPVRGPIIQLGANVAAESWADFLGNYASRQLIVQRPSFIHPCCICSVLAIVQGPSIPDATMSTNPSGDNNELDRLAIDRAAAAFAQLRRGSQLFQECVADTDTIDNSSSPSRMARGDAVRRRALVCSRFFSDTPLGCGICPAPSTSRYRPRPRSPARYGRRSSSS